MVKCRRRKIPKSVGTIAGADVDRKGTVGEGAGALSESLKPRRRPICRRGAGYGSNCDASPGGAESSVHAAA